MLTNWGNVKTEKMVYISGILIILNHLKDTALYMKHVYGLQCNIKKKKKTEEKTMRDL